jgi:hypothetical protein
VFDAAADLLEAIDRLATEPLDVAPGALSERLKSLAAASERLQAEILRTTAAWDASQAWAVDGAPHPRPWLTNHTRCSDATAHRLVRSARHVQQHERTAKTLAEGGVTAEHVDLLAQAAAHGRAAIYAEHEESLLDAAKSHAPREFKVLARRWAVLADDELSRRDAFSMYERRHVHLSRTFRGAGVLHGYFDPEATGILDAALSAYDAPDPTGGPTAPRTAMQRRADAMIEMAKVALSAKGERGAVVTGADLVVDVETLGGASPADLDRARCDLEHAGPVARTVIERLLCESALARVVTDARGVVLDLGRTSYRPSRAQRRALRRMYAGCAFPGCDRPFRQCDVHHLLRYPDGPTDLDNLVPLCRHHHVLTHEGGWRLRRDPDGRALEAVPP